MRTIFLDTLAHFRGQVLGWGLATFLMGVLTVIRYNIFQDNQEPIRQLLAGEVGDLIRMFGDVTRVTTPGGFLSLALFSFLPLVLGAFAVRAGSGLVDDAGKDDGLLRRGSGISGRSDSSKLRTSSTSSAFMERNPGPGSDHAGGRGPRRIRPRGDSP